MLAELNARASLLSFAAAVHPGWMTGDHHRQICEALEAVERGDIKRLIIEAPPRHSKSILASQTFPAWYLGRNPDKDLIACSYGFDLAQGFGRKVRNLIGSDQYRSVFPGVNLSADSKSAGRLHTSFGGQYIAAGVGGAITGHGAHGGIIDDPFKNREDADSPKVRDSVWNWYLSTFYTRQMPGAWIIMMLTRWHEDDLAARAMKTEDWHVISLPAIANEGTDHEAALWPEWFNLETLQHKRSVLSAREWSALYQQKPRAEDGDYMRREWFSERFVSEPSPLNVYMASDFAVTDSSQGSDPDWTEHGVFGIGSDGRLYVLDWWRGQTMSDEWIERLIDLAAKHKPLAWFGEAGVIRRAIEPFLRKRCQERRVFFRQEWLPSIKSKEIRGRAFQARASMGQIVFPRTSWADLIIDQCIGFPGAAHDDSFDVLSLMCLTVDKAHPAILARAESKPVDRWDRKFNRKPASGWKVA